MAIKLKKVDAKCTPGQGFVIWAGELLIPREIAVVLFQFPSAHFHWTYIVLVEGPTYHGVSATG